LRSEEVRAFVDFLTEKFAPDSFKGMRSASGAPAEGRKPQYAYLGADSSVRCELACQPHAFDIAPRFALQSPAGLHPVQVAAGGTRGSVKKRGHDGGVKFAPDSPLEGSGFEPSVPLPIVVDPSSSR
jgi:hypothetical protein